MEIYLCRTNNCCKRQKDRKKETHSLIIPDIQYSNSNLIYDKLNKKKQAIVFSFRQILLFIQFIQLYIKKKSIFKFHLFGFTKFVEFCDDLLQEKHKGIRSSRVEQRKKMLQNVKLAIKSLDKSIEGYLLKYQVNNGCQAQGILFLLALNVLVSIGAAVLFTYMSYYSCSRVFQGAAGASYTFLIVNFALMSITKAWKQICIQFIFLLHLFVFVTMVCTLAFSVIQSYCGYNICVAGLNELEYYTWFNTQGIREKIQVSCYDDISVIEQKFLEIVKIYQDDTTFQYGDQFSILYGWPISFSVFMLVLSVIALIVTYRAIFSCNGCNVSKSDFTKNYFSFSDDEDDEDYEDN